MWQWMFDNAGKLSASLGLCMAGGGAYVAADLPRPVSHHWVSSQIELRLAEFKPLKNRMIDQQITTNNLRYEAARAEKITRETTLQTVQEPQFKQMLERRIEELNRIIEDIKHDDARLRVEKSQ